MIGFRAGSLLFVAVVLVLAGCGDDGGGTDGGPEDGGMPDAGDEPGADCVRNGTAFCSRACSDGGVHFGPYSTECGNGEVEPGEQCEPPGSEGCDDSCQRVPSDAPDPRCDMTGHWIVDKKTVSVATSLGVKATTHHYWYASIVQDGESLEVVDSINCSFNTDTGLVAVTVPPRTRNALRFYNDWNGRGGSYTVSGDRCRLELDVKYVVRALEPREEWLSEKWADLDAPYTSMPSKSGPEKPMCECPEGGDCVCDDTGRFDPMAGTKGWSDWDCDGEPGITFRVGSGKLFVSMRDWGKPVGMTPQGSDGAPLEEFTVNLKWSNTQTILAANRGTPTTDDDPDPEGNHNATFRRIEAPDRTSVSDVEICQMAIASFAE